MADSLHLSLSAFRDTMLTAVARLEFAIRDTERPVASVSAPVVDSDLTKNIMNELSALASSHTSIVGNYSTRIDILEKKLQSLQEQLAAVLNATEETKELLKIPPPSSTTKNVLISTPALSAAVAAVAVPAMELIEDNSESEVGEGQLMQKEYIVEEQEDVEMEAEEDEEEDNSPDLQQVMIKGKQYFMDAENAVYVETDEGYEEIGKYNSALDCIEGTDDAEEEEVEDEEGIEVEEFSYKGKTYQRDSENNVYDDGDHIGTWNGKKIVPLA